MIDSAVEKREMERKHATVQQRVSRQDVPPPDLSLTMSVWSVYAWPRPHRLLQVCRPC